MGEVGGSGPPLVLFLRSSQPIHLLEIRSAPFGFRSPPPECFSEETFHLHPADLADIIEDLSGRDRSAIFHALDTETAAEAMEEIDPKIQKAIMETIPLEKASDIVEEMSPSDAADLLGDLPKRGPKKSWKDGTEKAEDLRELLVHPDETAGGLMTTPTSA